MSRSGRRSGPVKVYITGIEQQAPRRGSSGKLFSDEISYSLSAPFVNDNDARILRELVYWNSGNGKRRVQSRLIRGKQARYGIIADPRELTPPMLKRVLMKGEDRNFLDACRLLLAGKPRKAYELLQAMTKVADAQFLAGMLALKLGMDQKAADLLGRAMEKPEDLGDEFLRHRVAVMFDLPVTATATAHVGPTLNGVMLAMVEANQRLRHHNDAMYVLRRLHDRLPRDIVVLLSLCEYLLDHAKAGPAEYREVVALTEGVDNDTYIHAGVLLLRAQACRRLGELEAAKDVLTAALRKTVDRTVAILVALRLERFELFMEMDLVGRAVEDLRKLRDLDPVLATRLERRYEGLR
ncbi:MAG: hypothetical protein R3F46_09450 [bacterium]